MEYWLLTMPAEPHMPKSQSPDASISPPGSAPHACRYLSGSPDPLSALPALWLQMLVNSRHTCSLSEKLFLLLHTLLPELVTRFIWAFRATAIEINLGSYTYFEISHSAQTYIHNTLLTKVDSSWLLALFTNHQREGPSFSHQTYNLNKQEGVGKNRKIKPMCIVLQYHDLFYRPEGSQACNT